LIPTQYIERYNGPMYANNPVFYVARIELYRLWCIYMVRNVLKGTTDKKLYDERLYVAMQPARKRILFSLYDSESYASKLADELSINPKVVQFHLDILQKFGLVAGNFDLESPSKGRPVAVRRFKLTDAGHDMIDVIRNIPHRP